MMAASEYDTTNDSPELPSGVIEVGLALEPSEREMLCTRVWLKGEFEATDA
jgi:hypothetical protein